MKEVLKKVGNIVLVSVVVALVFTFIGGGLQWIDSIVWRIIYLVVCVLVCIVGGAVETDD